MGRNPVLSPGQVDEAVSVFLNAAKGDKYRTFRALADRFDCHWRTVQNAVYNRLREAA